MNHLSEKNSVLNRPMYLCLCPVCLGHFSTQESIRSCGRITDKQKSAVISVIIATGTISSSTPKRKRKMRWQTNGNEKV